MGSAKTNTAVANQISLEMIKVLRYLIILRLVCSSQKIGVGRFAIHMC
jgi:hypothetical protein